MNVQSASAIQLAALRGELRFNESMRKHVSWRAGGAVARAYFPADLADLQNFLALTRRDEPLLFVGLGSNLLVRDGGFNGTVVFSHGALKQMRQMRQMTKEDGGLIYVEAGVASAQLARFVANQGGTGAEFFAGIPGTVGGALAMNAGCYGGQTWAQVVKVLTVDRQGQLHERGPEDFVIGYRHVGLRALCDEWFVAAWMRFEQGDVAAAKARIKALLNQRMQSQPLSLPNAGSVFRNPDGDYAARLIEAAGLKGFRLGGAQVSELHANFVVNPENKARASEIEMLIGRIQQIVREKFAVELLPEVRIVGETGEEFDVS